MSGILQNNPKLTTATGAGARQIVFNEQAKDYLNKLNENGLSQTDLDSSEDNNTILRYYEREALKGFRWRKTNDFYKEIVDFSSAAAWGQDGSGNTATDTTTTGSFIEGSQSISFSRSGTGNITMYKTAALDLSTYADGSTVNLSDYLIVSLKMTDTTKHSNLYIWFYASAGSKYGARAYSGDLLPSISDGWNLLAIRLSSFSLLSGFTDWSTIAGVYVYSSVTNTPNDFILDNMYLVSATKFQNLILDRANRTSGTVDNTDSTSSSTLTLGSESGSRYSGDDYSLYNTYLTVENSVTNGKGKEYLISSVNNKNIVVSGTLPTITDDVAWYIKQPLWEDISGTFICVEEDGMHKMASSFISTASEQILLCNAFKPTSANITYRLKAHFQFRASADKQGFVFDYVDANNYMKCYLDKSDGIFYLVEVIAGVTTSLYTFNAPGSAIADGAGIVLFLYRNKKRLEFRVYNPYLGYDYTGSYTYWNPVFQGYQSELGLYCDLDFRLLDFEAIQGNYELGYRKVKSIVFSGGSWSSGVGTITNANIYKTSTFVIVPTSALVGRLYISSVANGTLTITSTSTSETAGLLVEVYN